VRIIYLFKPLKQKTIKFVTHVTVVTLKITRNLFLDFFLSKILKPLNHRNCDTCDSYNGKYTPHFLGFIYKKGGHSKGAVYFFTPQVSHVSQLFFEVEEKKRK